MAKKILLVDDEPDITVSFKKGLGVRGFEVDVYNDPEDALSEFVPEKYDLAVIDLRMPKMNGLDLCQRIMAKDDQMRIFLVTAFEIFPEEFKTMLSESKIRRFIKKPVSVEALVAHINDEFKNL